MKRITQWAWTVMLSAILALAACNNQGAESEEAEEEETPDEAAAEAATEAPQPEEGPQAEEDPSAGQEEGEEGAEDEGPAPNSAALEALLQQEGVAEVTAVGLAGPSVASASVAAIEVGSGGSGGVAPTASPVLNPALTNMPDPRDLTALQAATEAQAERLQQAMGQTAISAAQVQQTMQLVQALENAQGVDGANMDALAQQIQQMAALTGQDTEMGGPNCTVLAACCPLTASIAAQQGLEQAAQAALMGCQLASQVSSDADCADTVRSLVQNARLVGINEFPEGCTDRR